MTAARAGTTDQDRADAQVSGTTTRCTTPPGPARPESAWAATTSAWRRSPPTCTTQACSRCWCSPAANSPTTAARFPRGEAVHYAEHAIALGVPAAPSSSSPRAANTGQNIEFSRRALAAAGIPVTSVMLISKPYMQRRAYATIRKTWPEADAVCASEDI